MLEYNGVLILICATIVALAMTSINERASDRALKVLTGYSIYIASAIAIAYLVVLLIKYGKVL